MVIFGLLLLILGVLGLLSGIFGSEAESTSSKGQTDVHTTLIGIELSATALFIVGAVSALLVLAGLWAMKFGAKQGWKRRKDQKRLSDLSDKLDEVELDRRKDDLSGREEK
ncbi:MULTISPECIES: hypothetical protein [unclassified Nocardioides]|uniref:hypothetical protein n=1 Tax=unclassified Nocardioides TaxID=2615069 RepID=UPI0006FC0067|nr:MULTISPECIES: hypothetical protein [unclassified Nocardioides]KRA29805.1 hypothetical protein ASD81_18995 [Nocardioides sp. Root614]KRA86728.1 hypothetical protein ASD84_21220 [Nocardioides sp. Root682]